jgi:26S proteasome regulatory subunit N10
MVLEAIILCMDNSDWTRNGDYHPSRWESEGEAANLISESKCEKNPENGIGVISMAGKRVEVHVTLTNDLSRILNSIKNISLSGECDFITSLNIATLTLKHRQNKNQKQRIVLFVGSPIGNKHSIEEMSQI